MKKHDLTDHTPQAIKACPKDNTPTLHVDIAKYQCFLDDPNLTPSEKEEFLRIMWEIIVNFVELGYGVHPLQELFVPASAKDGGSLVETEVAPISENKNADEHL